MVGRQYVVRYTGQTTHAAYRKSSDGYRERALSGGQSYGPSAELCSGQRRGPAGVSYQTCWLWGVAVMPKRS